MRQISGGNGRFSYNKKKDNTWLEILGSCFVVLVCIGVVLGIYYLLACFLAYVWDELIIPLFWEAGPHINQWQALALYIFISIIAGLFRTTVTHKSK